MKSLSVSAPELDVVPILLSGSSENRVDPVFFSDGYLLSERSKFMTDATRLAEDVSRNQTFYAVKPLLNFWAAFSPSNESGIGSGGIPKDTVYGLYRDGSELRAVYYTKPEVARAACSSLGTGCDYPILLANDPFYGGLGGEFTVITSSHLNGPLVLRHELGHSIINVGEEYDGGFAYCGVNAADKPEPSSVPWSHWLSPTSSLSSSRELRVEHSVMPLQAYPWTMLNTTTPWSTSFISSGAYSRFLVKFSLSGIPQKSNLKVELDGADLKWAPEPLVGMDRWHYDIFRNDSLQGGEHTLTFTLTDPELEDAAQLCSVEILEFGDESEFNSTPGHYSLYPTFSLTNETTYRPTNSDCLMRAVTKPNFCKACMENLWLELLDRVSLVDGVHQSCRCVTPSSRRGVGDAVVVSEEDTRVGMGDENPDRSLSPSPSASKTFLELSLVPLAHLRPQHGESQRSGDIASERYTILWSKDGVLVDEFTNRTTVDLGEGKGAIGKYKAEVRFSTDAIRLTDESGLVDTVEYEVKTGCP